MKILVHYPAVVELEVKIQFGETMVPATKVSRMLGFEKPRMAVREYVPCFWQYMLKDKNDQPVLYLDRSGFEALAKHSAHPHKSAIWKLILEAMDKAELYEKGIQANQYLDQILFGKQCKSTSKIAADYGVPVALFNDWLCAAGIQHWAHKYWITDEKYMAGHDDQEILWNAAGRLHLFQALKKEGVLPIVEVN